MNNSISSLSAPKIPVEHLNRGASELKPLRSSDGQSAEEVRQAFTEFVGKTFYSHMMKAMRNTQSKPAYFHGGRAEEVFQSQLDQMLVDSMAEASSDQFAEPMFERQFPKQAAQLKAKEASDQQDGLDGLDQLHRR